ncbi:MAG TPA: DUF5985 family protein [Tepidisphaeraceae bacterium]|jgi:hypothetical protein|nr:DUF5985 family protein [Tepidisphaeraceae bacterium]
MAESVYILCGLTCAACALFLFRGYRKSKVRLLLWSCLCFVGLTLNNVLLFLDLIIFTHTDLLVLRTAVALLSLLLLAVGLIWDSH